MTSSCKLLFRRANVRLAVPVNKKEPVTPTIMNSLYKHFMSKNNCMSIIGQRTMLFAVISYTGFMRFDEASNIQRSDIIVYESFMTIFIEKSKTDLFRQGNIVFIAKFAF